ncbi:MAG TPA: hypothetical protein VK186_15470, partial [Candidatus Deferrimicrobium sp.]|nr:hypothetical protein [Candidatus Deferrimicrobium sp.]
FLYLLIFLFSFQALLLLIKIYFLPPHLGDVFSYHLHPVVEWFQQNKIPTFIDTPVLRLNRNPLESKLLHFWIVKFARELTWVELPQFVSGLVVTLTSYTLMLKMNIKKNSALRYAILIYFIPLILNESRTCQDHLALTAASLIATLYFINVFFEKNDTQLLFLGLSFGLLLGLKINGPQIIIIFFLALFLTKGFKLSHIRDFLKKNILQIILGMMAALILGGYWYFKNVSIFISYLRTIRRISALKIAIIIVLLSIIILLLWWAFKKLRDIRLFKNKKVITVFVILLSIIAFVFIVKNAGLIKTFVFRNDSPSALLSDKTFYAQHPFIKAVKSDFARNVLLFPYRVKDIGLYNAYSAESLEQSGFGVQFFGFGLLAYAVMMILIFRKKYRDSMARFVFFYSLALLVTYFFYYFSKVNYRLFMFFPIFGLMLWAFLIAKWNMPKIYLKLIDGLILVMVLFNMTVVLFEGNSETKRWQNMLTINNPVERTAIKYSPFFKQDDWLFIDNYIQPTEPIGYMAHTDSWIFPYFDNRMERRIYYLRSLKGFRLIAIDNKNDLLEFNPDFKKSLKKRKIHYIHFNAQGVRNRWEYNKHIIIDDKEVYRITDNLFYFKW